MNNTTEVSMDYSLQRKCLGAKQQGTDETQRGEDAERPNTPLSGVIPWGVEPQILWLKTRCPRPLDDGTEQI